MRAGPVGAAGHLLAASAAATLFLQSEPGARRAVLARAAGSGQQASSAFRESSLNSPLSTGLTEHLWQSKQTRLHLGFLNKEGVQLQNPVKPESSSHEVPDGTAQCNEDTGPQEGKS